MDKQLSTFISQPSPQRPEPPPSKKGLELWGVLLPWILLIGFLTVAGVILAPNWMPARELNMVTVVTIRHHAEQTLPNGIENSNTTPSSESSEANDPFSGPVAFQASGWIEPNPHPTLATSLVDGVIRSVHVLEGDLVKKGQVLATLIDDDAKLDLKSAQVQLDAQKAIAMAQAHRIKAVDAELLSLTKNVDVAKAKRDLAAEQFDRLSRLPSSAVAEQFVVESQLTLNIKEAELKALQAREAELTSLKNENIALNAKIQAEVQRAETEVQRRQLQLDRTIISSPMDGRVMRLMAAPGSKKMLNMDHPHSATIALLYDPQKIQARLDIPLSEASQLFLGQGVLLKSNYLPEHTFRAIVTSVVGEADLQRNTLQVKVRFEQPDDRLRPDMLCRGEFLSSSLPSSATKSTSSGQNNSLTHQQQKVQVYIPLNAVVALPNEKQKAMVWKVGPDRKKIYPQEVTLGHEQREDHIHILKGLLPGDRVVSHPPSDLVSGENFRAITPHLDSKKL